MHQCKKLLKAFQKFEEHLEVEWLQFVIKEKALVESKCSKINFKFHFFTKMEQNLYYHKEFGLYITDLKL